MELFRGQLVMWWVSKERLGSFDPLQQRTTWYTFRDDHVAENVRVLTILLQYEAPEFTNNTVYEWIAFVLRRKLSPPRYSCYPEGPEVSRRELS